MIKRILLKILHLIRYFLTILKKNILPEVREPTVFEKYTKDQLDKSYNHFKSYFGNCVFLEYHKTFEYIIKKAKENDEKNEKFYLEFGVYVGTTINLFSKFVDKIYGFDSFEGLREDWLGHDVIKGHFNLNKKKLKFNKNVVIVKGWVQDTLVPFLKDKKPQINFVHMDMDTYETTKFVLENIKPYLSRKCIILFDEIYNYPGWQVGEYKSLKEVFNENEYKFILFSKNRESAAIQVF